VNISGRKLRKQLCLRKQNKNSASGACKGLQRRGWIDRSGQGRSYLLAPLAVHNTNTRWWQATETAGDHLTVGHNGGEGKVFW
jgi:DNA-binding IclR family transcriptional regulator